MFLAHCVLCILHCAHLFLAIEQIPLNYWYVVSMLILAITRPSLTYRYAERRQNITGASVSESCLWELSGSWPRDRSIELYVLILNSCCVVTAFCLGAMLQGQPSYLFPALCNGTKLFSWKGVLLERPSITLLRYKYEPGPWVWKNSSIPPELLSTSHAQVQTM